MRRDPLTIVIWALVVVSVFCVLRVLSNEAHRLAPPPACQVWGGSWSAWDGWQCG